MPLLVSTTFWGLVRALLGFTELSEIVGQNVVALSHGRYSENVGLTNLDLLTSGGKIYRFETEEFVGELTADGWTCEHYSLTLEPVETTHSEDIRVNLSGVVVEVTLVKCHEWLAAVDLSLPAIGSNPRTLFAERIGSCPPDAKPITVVCGVVLRSAQWDLMVQTHSFPFNIDFSTDPVAIRTFLERFSSNDA